MRLRLVLSLGLAAASLSATAASATTLTAAEILKDFNGVIYDNASTQSDVEGAIVVGGNFSGATVYNHPNGVTQPAGYGALTVFGSTSGNSINMDNGGSAYVAGTKGASINFNGGGSYISAPGSTISDFETPLNALSTSLSKLTANSTLPKTDNNEVINAAPDAKGVAIFDITSTELDAIPSYNIALNGAKTVIFNVDASTTGGIVSFNANDETGDTGANQIIWNFYNATSLSLGTQIAGTILAPNATVSNATQIDGDLVAKTWTGNGELHSYGFTGVLPPSGVPEPSAWALMLVGVGGLGGMLRRRRVGGLLAA